MSRPLSLVALFLLGAVAAAAPPPFRFTKGETLSYHLVQTTNIAESMPDELSCCIATASVRPLASSHAR